MVQSHRSIPGPGFSDESGVLSMHVSESRTDADRAELTERAARGGARSRREFFSGAGLGAFWAAVLRFGPEARAATPPVSADIEPNSLLTKLVRRITQGYTGVEMALANSLGYSGYLEHHLNYAAIDDTQVEQMVAGLPTISMLPYQLYAQTPGVIQAQLILATIWRSVYSRRQLYQRMVEFWTDHFNIDITQDPPRFLKTVDDRDVIRPHALGTFPALLSASAHSPAMLTYLDNDRSIVGNPNENYARELMELHSLGVDGGYTQQDVQEVARCFTGWGLFNRSTQQQNSGLFRFNPAQHDNGQKLVLGNIIPAGGGQQDGETVLSILGAHPSTANFISKKLCRWFFGEDAPAELIGAVASTYTATAGDIRAMIRTVLAPNVLADARPRYKRPYHQFVSAMRAVPTTIGANVNALRNQLNAAGHQPFYWGPPDGYPDTLEYWSGLILPRWNFGAALMAGTVTGVTVDFNTFLAGLNTAQQVADKIDTELFGGEMDPVQKDAVRQYMLPDPPTLNEKREAIGLAMASPGFQWY